MDNYQVKLKKILAASGLTQESLAGKLGVSFATLNSWANGKSEPREKSKDEINRLVAEYLGTDSVDQGELKTLKNRIEQTRYSVRVLLRDKTLLERLTTSLTYHSNATEGSTMTERDVEEVVYNNQILKNRTSVEQREAINHRTALYFLLDELARDEQDFRITPDLIKSTHLRLMNGIISDAGYFRDHGVRISGSSTPVANYLKIPSLIVAWSNRANAETNDPLETLASLHASFEKIHPFSDGNGRTGRLLLFVLSLKFHLPPAILRKERKQAYYQYLELAQTRDLLTPLEKFLAEEILNVSTQLSF